MQSIIAWLNMAIPPVLLAGGLRFCYQFYNSRFSQEALRSAKDDQEKRRRLRRTGLIFSLLLGLAIVSLLTLSLIGLSVFRFRCFQNPATLPSIVVICALLSFDTFGLGSGSNLVDWLVLGISEVVLGLTAYGGLLVVLQLPALLGAGAFYAVLFFGSVVGLWIRTILFKNRRVRNGGK